MGVIYRIEPRVDRDVAEEIDALIGVAPNAHFTQHPDWAAVSPEDPRNRWLTFYGRDAGGVRVAALVRTRRTPVLGYAIAEVFRGPVAEAPSALLNGVGALHELLKSLRPIAVRIDPYWSGPDCEEVRRGLAQLGFTPMAVPPWHVRSLEIDIDRDAEALIMSFKPATRRQLRKALKMQIDVREDLDDAGLKAFHRLYEQMAATKGTGPRPVAFFRGIRDFFRSWPQRGFWLSSWLGPELLGAISVFTLGDRAIYGYGASSLQNPEVPKSHLLHFLAMQRAGERGCVLYDMGGFAAGVGDSEERTPTQKINYFKSGFGGQEVEFVAGHERVLRPVAYQVVQALRSSANTVRRLRAGAGGKRLAPAGPAGETATA
jgi:lipid II:glycine glycyltransferase (peptidoglycan interpeptide bridge formation enzyme)